MRLRKWLVSCCFGAIVGSAPAHGAGLARAHESSFDGAESITELPSGSALSTLGILNVSMNALLPERLRPRAAWRLPDNTPILGGCEARSETRAAVRKRAG